MIEAALESLRLIVDPELLLYLLGGVLFGIVLGIIPGLGGVVGMAILLPFAFGLDYTQGIFLMIGVLAVSQTSDSFPAVLFGIPGTTAAQATVMDGHPLAKQGKAGLALGAAFSSSMLGGVLGAMALLLVIPVARPMVLALGSPELLMLCLVGLSMVAVVSFGSALLGLVSALIGLALASIGTATTVLEYRYTFDLLVLRDGVSLVIVALALFAIPETLQLLVQNTSVVDKQREKGGLLDGLKATLANFPLVARNSAIAIGLGLVPGIGGNVIDWITYGTSVRSKKNKVEFGKGEIRGVIAPEAANNAKEGGALIPTLFFSIPGSATMAMLLGALTLMGVQTGPAMAEGSGISFVIMVAWALCLSNVLATAICFGASRWMAKLSLVPATILAPFLFVIVTWAAFQNNQQWADIVLLLVLGALGWVMYCLKIPRAPLLIGFVLGPSVERYLWISLSRYGFDWLLFPGVITIFAILILVLVFGTRVGRKKPAVIEGETGVVP